MHLSCGILSSLLFLCVSGMESAAMAQLQALHTLQGMGGIQVHAPPPPTLHCNMQPLLYWHSKHTFCRHTGQLVPGTLPDMLAVTAQWFVA